ncbi:hypothetical protein PVAP13_3NG275400 [Panicum virgatum]|uniref:Uncharacterized protein n=1 Tax=Panicum virgatum TaxID=38727 RepID=A0A8T0UMB0_PANVG|nr:hypothetical protein PVAP13_3NG275400 [Panicum virgatum]
MGHTRFVQGQCVPIWFHTSVFCMIKKVVHCVGAFAKQVDMMDLQEQSCRRERPSLQVSLGPQQKVVVGKSM